MKGVKGDAGENCTFVTGDNDGEIVLTCGEKQTTLYKAVCGTTPYDPATKFCFNMELNDLCNNEVYDPENQFCAKFADNTEQVYKYVTVAPEGSEYSKTWMAENLNYKTANSWCYEDNDDNCAKYGRLYTWAAANTACPDGWHLPSLDEWKALIVAVDGNIAEYANQNVAGTALKSTSGWNNNGNGTDAFGFSALPAGARYYNGSYYKVGYEAYFWSFSENGGIYAYAMYLHSGDGRAYLDDYDKDFGLSVRCLKD